MDLNKEAPTLLATSSTAPAPHSHQSAQAIVPSSPSSHTLPDSPLVTIEPTRSWAALDLRDLWAYRELFFFLTWRDVKVRYKQTLLGAAWAILQPVCSMIIFTLIFGRLARIPTDGIPYPLFAYAGLLPWLFFANAVTNSGNSLVGSSHLITKVYFPRMLIPGAAVAAGLVEFAIAFTVLVGLMIYYGVGWTWQLMMVPGLVVLTVLLATGVGMWMSAMNVRYRDVRFALPFMMQLWFFTSPVIYPGSLLGRWEWVMMMNPMAGIIEGMRAALFGRGMNWVGLGISAVITIVVLIYAAYTFRRMEKSFADVI
jgi:lipopolysaccharide transport system permease protein